MNLIELLIVQFVFPDNVVTMVQIIVKFYINRVIFSPKKYIDSFISSINKS